MCNVAAVGQKVTGQKVSDIGQKLFHFVYLEPFLYIKNLIIYYMYFIYFYVSFIFSICDIYYTGMYYKGGKHRILC